MLWKHLVLSPWKLDESGQKVLDDEKKHCGEMKTRQKHGKALRNDVTTFSLYHHSPDWCNSHTKSTLQLPNLHTLRLYLDNTHWLHTGYTEQDCRLLRSARPKVIVLHDAGIGSLYLDDMEIPREVCSDTHTLFLISRASRALESTARVFRFYEEIPTLRYIYWMYEPVKLNRSNVSSDMRPLYHSEDFRSKLAELALNFPDARLTVINSGIVQHYSEHFPKITIKAFERRTAKDVRKKMDDKLRNYHRWSDEKKRERVENMSFMSLTDFIEKEAWWQYLEVKEVKRWQKLMRAIHKKNRKDVEARKVDGGNSNEPTTIT